MAYLQLLGRHELERSEGLLSLPGCGRVLCPCVVPVRRVSSVIPGLSAVNTQIKNLYLFTVKDRA